MADTGKKPDLTSDTQDTYYEGTETQDPTQLQNQPSEVVNESLNESQDFCLIDEGAEDSIEENPEVDSKSFKAVPVLKDDKDDVIDKVMENISLELEKSIVDKDYSHAKKNVSSDEDEVVQGTPPHTSSPTRKESLITVRSTPHKRKAELDDEPKRKIAKIQHEDDPLILDKKESIDKDSDVSVNKEKSIPGDSVILEDTQALQPVSQTQSENDDSAIIAESQETQDDLRLILENSQDASVEVVQDTQKILIEQKTNSDDTLPLDEKSVQDEKKETKEEQICPKETNGSAVTENKSNKATPDEPDNSIKPQVSSEKSILSTPEKPKSPCKDNLAETKRKELNKTPENTKTSESHVRNLAESMEVDEADEKEESKIQMEETPAPPGKSNKSRMSIEVIFDRKSINQDQKVRSAELVEIDEDGEKIVLDSSQEELGVQSVEKGVPINKITDDTVYKSCYDSKSSSDLSYKSIGTSATKELTTDISSVNSNSGEYRLTNGSSGSAKQDTDCTESVKSDIILEESRDDSNVPIIKSFSQSPIKKLKLSGLSTFSGKTTDHPELLSISANITDSEGEVSLADDLTKSQEVSGALKTFPVEKEFGIYMRLKCLLHVDENTKELVSKEVVSANCDAVMDSFVTRRRNSDQSACLADISGNDNKDTSPGSVNSNCQPYKLHPSRLSMASTVSSSSSVSSAASLAAKLIQKDNAHFMLPRGPAKHAKKPNHECQQNVSSDEKTSSDEQFDRLVGEWKNSKAILVNTLRLVNAELHGVELHNGTVERSEDSLKTIHSSTPDIEHQDEIEKPQISTPKSTKKGSVRVTKRTTRSKGSKLSRSNVLAKASPKPNSNVALQDAVKSSSDTVVAPSAKTMTNSSTPVKQGGISVETLRSSTPQNVPSDDLIGKEVFAKWSDNNYYPGTVISKTKVKLKVHFHDGKTKLLIEDFVIPVPKTLNEGLSVYAINKESGYGSCGIIVDSEVEDQVTYYTVETDEGEKLRVQVKDIFLTADQAQVLREEVNSQTKSLPSTPQRLSQVTLDNIVDGKRRSKRIGVALPSTPKSRRGTGGVSVKTEDMPEPSVSGVATRLLAKVENETEKTSDSNSSAIEDKDIQDTKTIHGVEPEIIGTPYEQVTKGPQNRVKGKPRSKKNTEDKEMIAMLGPIPNSNIFKGVSFVLTCASVQTIDRYRTEVEEPNLSSESEPGTENEEEWIKTPFVRDRLKKQIIAGGGRVYDDLEQVPRDDYKKIKLITNIPNLTAKSIECLSLGIPAYNHNWIIRCCQQNKMLNPDENILPAGWSLGKRSYVDMFQPRKTKPFNHAVIVIPILRHEKLFQVFWGRICENAGAKVIHVDDPAQNFEGATVVVTNNRCPSWVVEKANNWEIPLVSTTWVVQCLVEGNICPCDTLPSFKYTYVRS
ncbi:titin homolog [Cephus cinctus]|uniref:Titin homolog n=1 Tax=Cephus cinctus TaxID=211228 RepID=A0AAJ7RI68_CEPCN|nr:titin homolog [Cephus cinctus]XP_024941395.1 titin homolog [Cephus cinctus]